ncbi:hypothetical protein SCLCIDRAFT_681796 [Scleroderma citrinum Foug A]|uniref:Uncharacterized protein n=1 Tax=Scleroderma citrinum Foug A TaxID=1036808 RepID=A0A0C3AGJ3_9AGAM|nr:hypothetical protein SCLCIDRAFT_681796 [Scleroderma citrinum Foug A]
MVTNTDDVNGTNAKASPSRIVHYQWLVAIHSRQDSRTSTSNTLSSGSNRGTAVPGTLCSGTPQELSYNSMQLKVRCPSCDTRINTYDTSPLPVLSFCKILHEISHSTSWIHLKPSPYLPLSLKMDLHCAE